MNYRELKRRLRPHIAAIIEAEISTGNLFWDVFREGDEGDEEAQERLDRAIQEIADEVRREPRR